MILSEIFSLLIAPNFKTKVLIARKNLPLKCDNNDDDDDFDDNYEYDYVFYSSQRTTNL